MDSKRAPVTITMPLEEWQHVLGLLRFAKQRTAAPTEAVVIVFEDAYKKGIANSMSDSQITAAADKLRRNQ